MRILDLLATAALAPVVGLAAPTQEGSLMVARQAAPKVGDPCPAKPALKRPEPCKPDPTITPEQTAKRSYEFHRAFLIDADPLKMFSFINSVYIQHNPDYHPTPGDGPQGIWNMFCGSTAKRPETSAKWCFDMKTNDSYADYGNVDRWTWVDGCVNDHYDGPRLKVKFPSQDKCYQLPK